MKTILVLLCLGVTASAQVVPTTPTKFGKRDISGGINNGTSSASVGLSKPAPAPTIVRTTTYWSLTGARQWTSTEGAPLLAKMIAFEDLTVEQVQGQPAPDAPKLPGKATVVREGKVRLLVGQQPREVPLDRLCEKDREFIATVQRAVDATPVK